MFEFLTILNLFLPGFLLSAIFANTKTQTKKAQITIDWLFILRSIVWSIILISLIGILLLEFSQFSLIYFQGIFGVLNLILFAVNFTYENLKCKVPKLKITKFAAVFILLLILNIFLKMPPSNHIHGGQDQGVYVNVANELVETGDIWVDEPLLKEAFTNEDAQFLQKYYKIHPETPVRDAHYEGWRTPGYYIVDKEEGLIVPQFYHLHAIWMALSNMIFGPENTTFSILFFSMLGIPFMYLFFNSFIKNRWLTLFIIFIYSINLLTVWMTKYPLSETMAAFFVLVGFYYLYEVYDGGSKKMNAAILEKALIAGLFFGLFSFIRGDGFVYLPIFALIYLLLPHIKKYIIVFNLFFILLAWSTLHAMQLSFPYFFDVFNGLWPGLFDRNYVVFIVSMFTVFILSINVYKHYLGHVTEKCIEFLRKVSVKIYILIAAPIFGFFLSKIYNFLSTNPDTGETGIYTMIENIGVIVLRGEGFDLSILHLIVLLGPLLFICGLLGVYKLLKSNKHSWIIMLFFGYAAFFQYIYVVVHGGLIYYARYQFTALFPLMFLFFGIFLKNSKETKTWQLYGKYLMASVVLLLYLHTAWTNPIYAKTELEGAYDSVENVASHIKTKDSAIFMDTSMIPRFGAPMMYTFHKGAVFNNDNLFAVYEEGGKLIEIFNQDVYLLEEDKVPKHSLYHNGFELQLLSEGILPIHVSGGGSRVPKVWHDSDPPYYLYQLVASDADGYGDINTFSIFANSSIYEFEGLFGLNKDTFAWTNGNFKIKEVQLYLHKDDTYSDIYMALINSGHFPTSIELNLEILINGESVCKYAKRGDALIFFEKCRIPEKFYNQKVDIGITSNTWVPAEIWSHSSNTNSLGIDFQELQVEFIK